MPTSWINLDSYRPQFNRSSIPVSWWFLDVRKRGLGSALAKTKKSWPNVSFKNSWHLREIRHIFDLWMITSNTLYKCNFKITNVISLDRISPMSINSLDIYFFVCLFICFFQFSLPSRCCRKEQEIMVIMNISWKENYYENDHDYYEHLLEGNITLTMCKFSFHFPSNLLGIMKFGWDGWLQEYCFVWPVATPNPLTGGIKMM